MFSHQQCFRTNREVEDGDGDGGAQEPSDRDEVAVDDDVVSRSISFSHSPTRVTDKLDLPV